MILVKRREVVLEERKPMIHRGPYHYVQVWGLLAKGDYVKVTGSKSVFRFDAVAVDDADPEVVRHVSLFELDDGGVSMGFRALHPDRIVLPTEAVVFKQRKQTAAKKEKARAKR